MSGIDFTFKINSSFIKHPAHQITIPRGQVSYKQLEANKLYGDNFFVVFPHGERSIAKMHQGVAGYGIYFQLQFTGANRTVPCYVEIGQHIHVLLTRLDGIKYAILHQVTH